MRMNIDRLSQSGAETRSMAHGVWFLLRRRTVYLNTTQCLFLRFTELFGNFQSFFGWLRPFPGEVHLETQGSSKESLVLHLISS